MDKQPKYTEFNRHVGEVKVYSREGLEKRLKGLREDVERAMREIDAGGYYEGSHAWFREARERDFLRG